MLSAPFDDRLTASKSSEDSAKAGESDKYADSRQRPLSCKVSYSPAVTKGIAEVVNFSVADSIKKQQLQKKAKNHWQYMDFVKTELT